MDTFTDLDFDLNLSTDEALFQISGKEFLDGDSDSYGVPVDAERYDAGDITAMCIVA